jgi:hypothetical protein
VIEINSRKRLVICGMLLAAVMFFAVGCANKKEINYPEEIINYCKKVETFTFSDVLDFEWNIAYVDYDTYMTGEKIKEKYNLNCELEYLGVEGQYRIVFCKDDKFIKEIIFDLLHEIKLDYDIEVIKPDTLFTVSWEYYDDGNVLNLW